MEQAPLGLGLSETPPRRLWEDAMRGKAADPSSACRMQRLRTHEQRAATMHEVVHNHTVAAARLPVSDGHCARVAIAYLEASHLQLGTQP